VRLLALIVAAACVSGAARAEESHAPDTARAWLRALYDGDGDVLTRLSALPFTYREAWPKKKCSAVAKDKAGYSKAMICLRGSEKLLLQELRWDKEDPSHVRLTLGLDGGGKKLRALVKGAPAATTWVSGAINGDGVTYELLFGLRGHDVNGGRVAFLVIDASFDSE
jgi:hypothetical protein